jgi:hypothetical protein
MKKLSDDVQTLRAQEDYLYLTKRLWGPYFLFSIIVEVIQITSVTESVVRFAFESKYLNAKHCE